MNRRFGRALLAVAMLGIPIGIGAAHAPADAACLSVTCLPVGGGVVLGSGGLPGDGTFQLNFSLSNVDGTSYTAWIYGNGTLSGATFSGSGNLGAYDYTNNTGFNSTVTVSGTLATTGPVTGTMTVRSTGGTAFQGNWALTGGNDPSNFQFAGLAQVGP